MDEQPREQPEPAQEYRPRERQPRESESRSNRPPRAPRENDREDRKVVVGLGDHVPAFLQRPVPVPRTGTE
jgi:hypothetical protein